MLQAVLTGESRSVSKIWRRRLSSGQPGRTHSGGSLERLAPEFPASRKAARETPIGLARAGWLWSWVSRVRDSGFDSLRKEPQ